MRDFKSDTLLATCFWGVLLVMSCDKSRETPAATEPARLQAPAESPVAVATPAPLDPAMIGQRLGVEVAVAEDGAVRASIPRKDMSLTVDGMPYPAAAGLRTTVVFRSAPSGASLVGSAVLYEDEVSPAMDAALAHGMEVTALHDRFFFDEPRVAIMHFVAEGDAALLASGVQAIGAATRDARLRSPRPMENFPGDAPLAGTLDAVGIGAVFGVQANVSDGVLQISIAGDPAQRGARFADAPLLWASFFGSDVRAAVDGGFTLTPHQVQPVLQALRRANINIVAVQQHGIGHEPGHSLVYFHARGTSLALAQAVQAALSARLSKGG
jgi:uncharacterized protein DUF1259